ncbi:MAG: lysine--tRNA ligase [Angelakisella sp.]|jgi:lysyl-tRNA synthetase class 2|nr:lysine--tRNA ligase [Angelakisella sp.]MCI9667729.1 lysine--tRNA ligase [Angelakisella sp.]
MEVDLEQRIENAKEKLGDAVEKAAGRAEEAAQQLSQEVYTEQVRVRREKLSALQAEGHDPFTITKYPVSTLAMRAKADFAAHPEPPEGEEVPGPKVSLAGRLMTKRGMGKVGFADLQDGSGRIQLYVRKDIVGEESYAAYKKFDIGDIVGVTGEMFRTKMGEISVRVQEITLLSKALLPLPDKWSGLRDIDTRYRQRYVDLIVNPGVKITFYKRSRILSEIRKYLDEKGFLEVDTPVLTPCEIGAAARPFITHHNTLDMDMYLRIETELYLKRLVVGGMDRVYEVGRIFRNEGMDTKHNPEFTTVELYQAYTDYKGIMDLVEEMNTMLAQKVCGSTKITYQGTEIDMGRWERLTMVEAVKKYSGADYSAWESDEAARACAKELHVEVPAGATKGTVLAELFDAFVEEKLIQPTIIYDYPVEISPLAKRKPEDPAFTERFEYFICAREMGNAFSELNDPIDQRQRFESQVAAKRAQEPNTKAEVDEDYVTAMEYGMPPIGGLGFGVDRLVMLLTDSASIRDVLLFPTMKPLEK